MPQYGHYKYVDNKWFGLAGQCLSSPDRPTNAEIREDPVSYERLNKAAGLVTKPVAACCVPTHIGYHCIAASSCSGGILPGLPSPRLLSYRRAHAAFGAVWHDDLSTDASFLLRLLRLGQVAASTDRRTWLFVRFQTWKEGRNLSLV